MDLNVILLAAGKGQRMSTSLPKVLHPVAGQPIIARSLKAISGIHPKQIRVVLGSQASIISTIAGQFKALCFKQNKEKWGTAQAVLATKPEDFKGDVLIVNGDHPLIQSADLSQFIRSYHQMSADCAVASFKNHQSSELGKLVFEGDQLIDIIEAYEVEKKNVNSEFSNAGLYLVKSELIQKYLPLVKKNIKEEYNLTDLISILSKHKYKVRAIEVPWHVAYGINNQRELSLANSIAFESNCHKHLQNGVVILNINHTYIEDEVLIGQGSLIYPGVFLRGRTKIGAFCAIESQACVFDSVIRNYVNIKAGSYIEGSLVGERSVIGPYAHLRPETEIGESCRVGNFVETKKIKLGKNSKVSHLSYLGDAEIGENVNVGCSTVTCNYGTDKKKRTTKINDNAFIGSGVQLIAPVEIGQSAVIGAGSVITKDVPNKSLSLERNDQKTIPNYKSFQSKKKN
ncbi:MAG: bifunctional UDP-N-acetylglucosamine diphosphorylase/glucosamine-1-phosphate N-acetyltransferase GlmU [Bdellovibrionales bacterium]|nr:bifunctional UDP-N-acetylglucosamine diphosphorylase/glucosamine-1-phosphate N-acetyltransferase GlmU [Bdellovibrionales bacterium]